MKKDVIIKVLARQKRHSAWDKGVLIYAEEIADNLCAHKEYTGERADEKDLLMGADNWNDYSYGGCSLIYDDEIMHRLSTPSTIKRNPNANWQPNKRETWLDLQTRALKQASNLVLRIMRKGA